MRPQYNIITPVSKRFWKNVKETKTCWIWSRSTTPQGYGRIYVNGIYVYAHRFSWELLNGPIPEGMSICHNCPGGDNPSCVRPSHLFLGTHADNMHDRDNKGRGLKGKAANNPGIFARGEDASNAKLTEKDVLAIRLRRVTVKESFQTTGHAFNVSCNTVRDIMNRKTWKHI
jgi:hypothetical protein